MTSTADAVAFSVSAVTAVRIFGKLKCSCFAVTKDMLLLQNNTSIDSLYCLHTGTLELRP